MHKFQVPIVFHGILGKYQTVKPRAKFFRGGYPSSKNFERGFTVLYLPRTQWETIRNQNITGFGLKDGFLVAFFLSGSPIHVRFLTLDS